MNREFNALLREALMCSVFVDPADPGLTDVEIFEIGRQAGFQDGEIGDTIPHVSRQDYGRDRSVPAHHDIMFSEIFEVTDPPLLDRNAAKFVIDEFNARIRADGARSARLDRGAVVERAVAAGRDRKSIEGAITCLVLGAQLTQSPDGVLTSRHQAGPIELFDGRDRRSASRASPMRQRALASVRDAVARRTDGRSRHAEPLDAFGEALERIGFRHFRAWWRQTVTELRGSDPGVAPVACAVLSAALVEGVLSFAARYARDRQLGAFQSSNFDGDPRNWKAERLIESASTGGGVAILTPQLKARAEHLNRMRQRVHVGRLLSEHPSGVPDLRPEEGRDAKATADQVVRAVLDWLDRASTGVAEGGAERHV